MVEKVEYGGQQSVVQRADAGHKSLSIPAQTQTISPGAMISDMTVCLLVFWMAPAECEN